MSEEDEDEFDWTVQVFCSQFLQQKSEAEQTKCEKRQWTERQKSSQQTLGDFLKKSDATCLALKLPNDNRLYLRRMRQCAHRQVNRVTLAAGLESFARQLQESERETLDLVGELTARIQEALHYQREYVTISKSKERSKKRKRDDKLGDGETVSPLTEEIRQAASLLYAALEMLKHLRKEQLEQSKRKVRLCGSLPHRKIFQKKKKVVVVVVVISIAR